MIQQFDVIIVGGGPTGMMLASELALANVKVLVLEKRSEPVAQSRATTVHPRTLEAFFISSIRIAPKELLLFYESILIQVNQIINKFSTLLLKD